MSELDFLARPSAPGTVATPEDLGDDERALATGIRAFMDREVLLCVGAEAARARALATLARLGPALLDDGGTRELLGALSAGAWDARAAGDEVARVVLELGGAP